MIKRGDFLIAVITFQKYAFIGDSDGMETMKDVDY